MDDDIRSLLGLRGYRVLEVSEEDRDAVVTVEPPPEDGCPRCGVISARSTPPRRTIVQHGWTIIRLVAVSARR